jgi:hypothetical protein
MGRVYDRPKIDFPYFPCDHASATFESFHLRSSRLQDLEGMGGQVIYRIVERNIMVSEGVQWRLLQKLLSMVATSVLRYVGLTQE